MLFLRARWIDESGLGLCGHGGAIGLRLTILGGMGEMGWSKWWPIDEPGVVETETTRGQKRRPYPGHATTNAGTKKA